MDDTMSSTPPDDGERGQARDRLVEELRLLMDVVGQRTQPLVERLLVRIGAVEHTGEGTASCDWCPLCRGVALLRGERPELAARLTEHVTGLLAVLRQALVEQPSGSAAGNGHDGDEHHDRSSSTVPGTGAAEPVSRVQRIRVERRGGECGAREC